MSTPEPTQDQSVGSAGPVGKARGNNPDHPWVQAIIVAKTGHHQDTIRCVTQASLAVKFVPPTPGYPASNFDHWLAGPFTKTVRRGSVGQIQNLRTWANENDVPYSVAAVNDSTAVAFYPVRYENMPRQIAKFQVSGTDFAWREVALSPWDEPLRVEPETWSQDAPVQVMVNADLTTGKAAAAAAHALWVWSSAHTWGGDGDSIRDAIALWRGETFPIRLDFANGRLLADLAERLAQPAAVVIRDSGLTEVDPRTLTAFAHDAIPSLLDPAQED